MAILFSNEFNIPEEDLRDLGAFNKCISAFKSK